VREPSCADIVFPDAVLDELSAFKTWEKQPDLVWKIILGPRLDGHKFHADMLCVMAGENTQPEASR